MHAPEGGLEARRARAAKNESLFREVNERLEELRSPTASFIDFVCECSRDDCAEQILLTTSEYEKLRREPDRFAISPGHNNPELDRVVVENDRYLVVEKIGAGADTARRLDHDRGLRDVTDRHPTEEQLDEVAAERERLQTENTQLRKALASRIVIEQAKGVLIERLDLPAEDVFRLLRSASRRARMNIHDVAVEVLRSRATPAYIEREVGHLLNRD